MRLSATNRCHDVGSWEFLAVKIHIPTHPWSHTALDFVLLLKATHTQRFRQFFKISAFYSSHEAPIRQGDNESCGHSCVPPQLNSSWHRFGSRTSFPRFGKLFAMRSNGQVLGRASGLIRTLRRRWGVWWQRILHCGMITFPGSNMYSNPSPELPQVCLHLSVLWEFASSVPSRGMQQRSIIYSRQAQLHRCYDNWREAHSALFRFAKSNCCLTNKHCYPAAAYSLGQWVWPANKNIPLKIEAVSLFHWGFHRGFYN